MEIDINVKGSMKLHTCKTSQGQANITISTINTFLF